MQRVKDGVNDQPTHDALAWHREQHKDADEQFLTFTSCRPRPARSCVTLNAAAHVECHSERAAPAPVAKSARSAKGMGARRTTGIKPVHVQSRFAVSTSATVPIQVELYSVPGRSLPQVLSS